MDALNEDRLWYAEQPRFDGTYTPVVTLGKPREITAERHRIKYRNVFPLPEGVTREQLPELGQIAEFFGRAAA